MYTTLYDYAFYLSGGRVTKTRPVEVMSIVVQVAFGALLVLLSLKGAASWQTPKRVGAGYAMGQCFPNSAGCPGQQFLLSSDAGAKTTGLCQQFREVAMLKQEVVLDRLLVVPVCSL